MSKRSLLCPLCTEKSVPENGRAQRPKVWKSGASWSEAQLHGSPGDPAGPAQTPPPIPQLSGESYYVPGSARGMASTQGNKLDKVSVADQIPDLLPPQVPAPSPLDGVCGREQRGCPTHESTVSVPHPCRPLRRAGFPEGIAHGASVFAVPNPQVIVGHTAWQRNVTLGIHISVAKPLPLLANIDHAPMSPAPSKPNNTHAVACAATMVRGARAQAEETSMAKGPETDRDQPSKAGVPGTSRG